MCIIPLKNNIQRKATYNSIFYKKQGNKVQASQPVLQVSVLNMKEFRKYLMRI